MSSEAAKNRPTLSPYKDWRMLVVTPDYASLRKMQKLFSRRFQRIEFEMDASSARDRLADIYAPSFKVVVVDEKIVKPKETNAWKKTLGNLQKEPVVMLLAADADNTPARIAASIGCVGIIDINRPGGNVVRQMLVSTGHLAPEPGEVLFDQSTYKNQTIKLDEEEPQALATIIAEHNLPNCPPILRELKTLQSLTGEAKQHFLKEASDKPLIGKALSRASKMIFTHRDSNKLQAAIERVGYQKAQELMIIATLQEAFSQENHAISGFELRLWRSAICHGKTLQALLPKYPEFQKLLSPTDALITGIIIVSGMIVLFKKNPNYLDLVDLGFQWDYNGNDQQHWERRRYGIGYHSLSHQVAKQWRVRQDIRMAIEYLYQRPPSNATNNTALMREMITLCHATSLRYLYDKPNMTAIKSSWQNAAKNSRISVIDMERLEASVHASMKDLMQVF